MNISETEGSRTKLKNKLLVSEINIEFVKPNNGIIAFASLVVDGNLYLSSVAIHKKLTEEGHRITYPSKGSFSIFHPINKATSKHIEEAIFKKLKEVMSKKNVCAWES